MSILSDVGTLYRAGALRPLGLRTTAEVFRSIAREGVRSHLIYTIHGNRDPSKPALISGEDVTTWGELLDRVQRLANHLGGRGLRPRDAIAIMLPNRPEFIETQAAALRAGISTSYVNPRAPAADAKALFERTGAKLCVTHRDDLGGDVPTLRVGDPYEEAIAGSTPVVPRVGRDVEGEIVIFTSGTTGRPKGAVRNLDDGASLGLLAGFLQTIPFHADDVHLVVCPLYHSSGSGFATVAQVLGNPLVLVEKFSPEAFCRAVERWKVTTTAVVPTMLHRLVDDEGTRAHDLSSLRVVVCTGSPLREDLRAKAREVLGDVLYDLYGSTEMGWVSVATPDDQRRKPGTVGKPVPHVEVKILDPDGREVPPGRPGEVWASSALLMKGYLDDPDLTSERVRDGYVSVRDVGHLDEDGYLHLVDRADDMIISGGVNVYPAEVEVVLSEHPRVSQVAAFGVPDEQWGQKIVAAVVASGDADPGELIAYCKQNASYAAVPKEVRFFEDLPRNDIGKIDKRRLVEEWTA